MSTPIPFEEYCDRYAEMTCGVGQDCSCFEASELELCKTYMGMECRDEVEAPVQEGRQSFDAAEAAECLGALHAIIADCSLDGADWPSGCDDMLAGRVIEGGACVGDDDCVAGLECWGEQCIVMPGNGQSCDPDYGCSVDTYCGDDDLCHEYRASGESCTEGDIACESDLYCNPTTVQCEPYVQQGSVCTQADWACDSDLYCAPASGRCEPYPSAGGPCADSGGLCGDELYCGDDQLCHPQLSGGQLCSDDEQCLSYSCPDGTCEQDDPPSSDVCAY